MKAGRGGVVGELLGSHVGERRSLPARCWTATVEAACARSGKLVEKPDVEMASAHAGDEHPLHEGFGWTNGVSEALAVTHGAPETGA